jgi:hypothetical protein
MSTTIKVYPFINNFLFPDYKNVIRFQSESHRVAFFSSTSVGGTNFSASGGTSAYQTINFNWNDGYETTIRITNTDNSSTTSSTNFLQNNYLHVVESIGELTPIQYFYFIVSAKFVNVDVIEYRVLLDVFTTHIQNISSDQPIMTERRHCQRWLRSGTTPFFNYRLNNKDAILGDDIDSSFNAKIPTSFQSMQIEYFTDTSTIPTEMEDYDDNFRAFVNQQLNDTLWIYAFILNPETTSPIGTSIYNGDITEGRFDLGYRVLVAPLEPMRVFRGRPSGTTYTSFDWSYTNLMKIINSNDINPRAISIRVSPVAPFNNRMKFNFVKVGETFAEAEFKYGTSGRVELWINSSASNTHADLFFLDVGSGIGASKWFVAPSVGGSSTEWGDKVNFAIGLNNYSVVQDVLTNTLLETYEYDNNLPFIPSASFPTNTTNKNKIYEPKLYTTPFKRLELSTGYSPVKELNQLYFSDTKLKLEVNDIPSIADQKYSYAISKSVNNPFYNQNLQFNNGLVGNNVYEFPIIKDKFADYVANHSNYILSGLAVPMIESLVGAGSRLATSNVAGAVSVGVGGGLSAIQFALQLDDLKKAPDTIKATGNNIIHDLVSNTLLNAKIVSYELTNEQKEMVFDYFYERGYRIMRESVWAKADASSFPSGYGSGDALFNRSRFNYIKLNDDELLRKLTNTNTPIMPKARDMIINVLNRGVRMIESSATASTTIANFNTTTENMEYNTTLT